jgi:hypothetical protein
MRVDRKARKESEDARTPRECDGKERGKRKDAKKREIMSE